MSFLGQAWRRFTMDVLLRMPRCLGVDTRLVFKMEGRATGFTLEDRFALEDAYVALCRSRHAFGFSGWYSYTAADVDRTVSRTLLLSPGTDVSWPALNEVAGRMFRQLESRFGPHAPRSAGSLAADTAAALTVRHLIGPVFSQAEYDEITLPWRLAVGVLHPDDPEAGFTSEQLVLWRHLLLQGANLSPHEAAVAVEGVYA